MILPRVVAVVLAGSVLTSCSGLQWITDDMCANLNLEHNDRWPRCPSAVARDPAIEAAVADLLSRLSLEEKVGQMMQAEIRYVTPSDIREYHLGSVLNGGGSFPGGNKRAAVADWVALADAYYEASMDTSDGGIAIPIIWGTDAVHGHNNAFGATIFPHNIGLGAAGNPDLIEQIGLATAREVAATGLDWVFAPTLAVVRDDRWGRTYEGYSEDPEIVRSYAGRMIEGLQGRGGSDELLGPDRVVATAKHFIGEGGTVDGIDQGDNRATEQELRDVHGQGYMAALAAGVQTVMATFNSWHGERVHGHRYLLTEVLKQQMGFDGVLVTDWNGFGQVDGCSNQACSHAINAGIDMLMAPQDYRELIANTIAQVRAGMIPLERIDDAVTRILRVKLRARLFEKGRPSARPLAGDDSVIGSPRHRAIARQAVRESLVLLKHRNAVLPIRPGSRVLVAGDGADDIGKQCGGWTLSWQGTGNTNEDFPGATSIYAGIEAAVAATGGEAELSVEGDFDVRPDVAIVVFGEEPYAEGQGDRRALSHSARSPRDLELLRRLKRQGIPAVALLLTGRPLWVNPEMNASDAFVVAWLPGSEGTGIADVLVADESGRARYDFTGRLRFSWPADARQANVNRRDADYAPLFPYGYGLSYGDVDRVPRLLPEFDSARTVDEPVGTVLRIFRGRALPPFRLFVGDQDDWTTPIDGPGGASRRAVIEIAAVDKRTQEDARRIAWSGSGEGRTFFQSREPQNLGPFLEQDGRLVFDVMIEQPVLEPLALSMGSDLHQGPEIDLMPMLRGLAPGEWHRISIELERFAGEGLRFDRIVIPFMLRSGGRIVLSLADVRIERGNAAHA